VADEALNFNTDDVMLCCLISAIVQLEGRWLMSVERWWNHDCNANNVLPANTSGITDTFLAYHLWA
jgi:hypothetical protein